MAEAGSAVAPLDPPASQLTEPPGAVALNCPIENPKSKIENRSPPRMFNPAKPNHGARERTAGIKSRIACAEAARKSSISAIASAPIAAGSLICAGSSAQALAAPSPSAPGDSPT